MSYVVVGHTNSNLQIYVFQCNDPNMAAFRTHAHKNTQRSKAYLSLSITHVVFGEGS